MIIRDQNNDALKGNVLRGFNNTPTSIKNQIENSKSMMQRYNSEKTPANLDGAKFDPQKQREMMARLNRMNK